MMGFFYVLNFGTGTKGASDNISKKEIAEAADPAQKLTEKEAEYGEMFDTPYLAAERGFIW
jgi:propionyl-CoA carboxylase beta chain